MVANVYKRVFINNETGKSYSNMVVVFDDGFELQVKPTFELSTQQYKALMVHINNLDLKPVEKVISQQADNQENK